MQERGITEQEVTFTVEAGTLMDVSRSRTVRRRVFTEGYSRGGRTYPHKEVTSVSTLEMGFNVVITVIARYGRWEGA